MFKLFNGDCLVEMDNIKDGSVDMILADLPYGTTSNKWDAVIPFEPLWKHYWRVLKPTGIICLTASQPFSSAVVMSQPKWFKHEWIWIKNRGSNFANTVREPMKEHEQVLIFSKGKWTYNKQMQERTGAGADRVKYELNHRSKSENYREFEGRENVKLPKLRVPSTWQKFNTCTSKLHPTVKPLPLFEYLIKTYTNEGDTVLDNTMGSGTTGVACVNLNRDFIGIEMDSNYFDVAKTRIEQTQNPNGFEKDEARGQINLWDNAEKSTMKNEQPLCLRIVSNNERSEVSVCDNCTHIGTSKWLDPCHSCIQGDLKEQTDC